MKLAVCGILIEDGKVLTVSRKDDHSKLGLPGGKVDKGELPQAAIIRECLEETGIKVKIDSIYSFADYCTSDYYVICYKLIRDSDEVLEVSEEETGKVGFVDYEKLIESSPFKEYSIKAFEYFKKQGELCP